MQRINPEAALRLVLEAPVISYDTETSGLTWQDFIVGYVIADFTDSYYVPVRHEAGGNIPCPEEFEAALAAAFLERGRLGYRTVGHNLNFDLVMSAKHGIHPQSPLEDTQINEVYVDDNTVGYGLDDCAARHGVAAKRGSELYAEIARRFGGLPDRKQMANFWRLPGDNPLVLDYACGDGITTIEVWRSQQAIIAADEATKSHKLDCDLIPYIARMKTKGVRIDQNLAATIKSDVEVQQKLAKAELPPGLNVRSPKEVRELFLQLGYTDDQFPHTEPSAKFPNGQPSFREQWLEGQEAGAAILQVRRLDKLVDSFITPLIETYNVDGRVHPDLNQSKSDEYGTNTGRLSCSNPNLQAFPKRNKQIGKIVRRLVVPDEGMILEEADFKQQEPRLFAHYSEDEHLVGGYLMDPPRDIHGTVSHLLNLHRDVAKRLGLGMLTGMQYNSLAGHMGCSVERAEELWNGFMDSMPGIKDFQNTARKIAKQRGYVRTILGRKARFPSGKFAYKATSRIIQGSGAEHMKTAILRAWQYRDSLPDPSVLDILMTIHDSNIWQRRLDFDNTELIRIIENVPHEPDFNLLLPIPVDLGSGMDWAEASYGK